MQELTTTATLVEYGTLEDGDPIAALFARSELEAALEADESVGLWFELGRVEDEETRRLTLELSSGDIEEMLRVAPGDEVIVALDADALESYLGEPDVEAHGMRGALAIAVATAAVAAPSGLAAVPQVSSAAATSQISTPAARVQVSNIAATAQISRAADRAQVRDLGAKTQISRSLVLKAAGLKALRAGRR